MEVPGRLAYGCTSLAAAWPFGGTEIGLLADSVLAWDVPVSYLEYEEYGSETVEVVTEGEAWSLACVLRSWDSDALSLFAPNSSVGAVTGKRVVSTPGTNRAGYLWSARGTALVFAPESVVAGHDDQHPLVVFHKALPHPARSAKLELRLGRKWGLPLVVVPVRSAAGRMADVGFRGDISL